jgi:hypothetical protein
MSGCAPSRVPFWQRIAASRCISRTGTHPEVRAQRGADHLHLGVVLFTDDIDLFKRRGEGIAALVEGSFKFAEHEVAVDRVHFVAQEFAQRWSICRGPRT